MIYVDLTPFIQYKTSRSSGSGGQNVNKVETKVTILFDVNSANTFTDEELIRIKSKLASRIQADGLIQIHSQDTRSQLKNKEIALDKLKELLKDALKIEKPRKKTKPSKAADKARLDAKRRQALRKIARRKERY